MEHSNNTLNPYLNGKSDLDVLRQNIPIPSPYLKNRNISDPPALCWDFFFICNRMILICSDFTLQDLGSKYCRCQSSPININKYSWIPMKEDTYQRDDEKSLTAFGLHVQAEQQRILMAVWYISVYFVIKSSFYRSVFSDKIRCCECINEAAVWV